MQYGRRFDEAIGECRTPRGARATFHCRQGTADWEVIEATLAGDEYGIGGLSLSGWALDLGAYIGSVAVALALDNPALHVLAVEPVPENVRLCQTNVRRNGVGARVRVIRGAVGPPGASRLRIRYRHADSEHGAHYHFVAHSGPLADGTGAAATEVEVPCYSLGALVALAGVIPGFVKIDCEGGEWAALTDATTALLPRLHGEWHERPGHDVADLEAVFAASHQLQMRRVSPRRGLFIATKQRT
jgi:FkbM family methyltransferase